MSRLYSNVSKVLERIRLSKHRRTVSNTNVENLQSWSQSTFRDQRRPLGDENLWLVAAGDTGGTTIST